MKLFTIGVVCLGLHVVFGKIGRRAERKAEVFLRFVMEDLKKHFAEKPEDEFLWAAVRLVRLVNASIENLWQVTPLRSSGTLVLNLEVEDTINRLLKECKKNPIFDRVLHKYFSIFDEYFKGRHFVSYWLLRLRHRHISLGYLAACYFQAHHA